MGEEGGCAQTGRRHKPLLLLLEAKVKEAGMGLPVAGGGVTGIRLDSDHRGTGWLMDNGVISDTAWEHR